MEGGVLQGNRKSAVRTKRIVTSLLTYAALISLSALFVAPFVWMVSTSLKPDSQIFQDKVQWIPRPAVWKNYPDALASFPFLLYLRNTLFVCAMSTLGTVLSSLLPAYGFSRIRWKGRDALFVILLATIMLPAQATMLPVFLIFRSLGWTGTFLPLIVPAFFGSEEPQDVSRGHPVLWSDSSLHGGEVLDLCARQCGK